MSKIWEILRKRYPANEYALMAEVRDASGFNASRSADFILMNLWPSRGLHLSGFELKSSRSDWLRELKRPDKAENIFQYCDYFWLLTDELDEFGKKDAIAKMDEIPQKWGWMAIKGGKVHIMKDAPKLEPKPLSRSFLGAMLKRACDKTDFVHISSIQDKIQAARESGVEDSKRSMEELAKTLAEANKIMQEFYQSSGIDLRGFYRWQTNPKKMGEAVKFLDNGGTEGVKKNLLHLKTTAEQILRDLTTNLSVLEQLEKPS